MMRSSFISEWTRRYLLVAMGLFVIGGGVLWGAGRGKISGRIVDAETRYPLPSVNVILVGTPMGAASDAQGEYYIPNIPVGVYSLRASMIGYREITVTDIRVSINATTEIDFDLEQETLAGEAVTITAERKLVDKDNTSSSMVLSTTDLEAQPTVEFTDVLLTLPSINMEDGEMKFRGGTLDEVAFLIDGTRVRNPLDHSPYTRINLSSLQEVEVITGSFNAEYGEAMSGVINIVTKEGMDDFEFFVDTRFQPPGKKHWGPSLYDRNTDIYWENSHALHEEWWIENTDQWVDTLGNYGYEADVLWTPEEAYQYFMDTHRPLTDYLNTPSYQVEMSMGGSVPLISKLYFFASAKYRSQAPLYGNAFRDMGEFFDGTLKLSLKPTSQTKLTLTGLYGEENTSWGVDGPPDSWYALNNAVSARYAYFDFPGLPFSLTSGLTLSFSHLISQKTMYEFTISRMNTIRRMDILPGDPIGWAATEGTRDILRGVDDAGFPVIGGYQNEIGYHTTGYYYRYHDDNLEWYLNGYLGSQINKYWYLKTGLEYTHYILDHYNQSKVPDRSDDRVYKPYQGALYFQNKLELGGLIVNAGVRFDFYNPNDTVYTDLWNPLASTTEKTEIFTQLSPRLGLSHPITDRAVLHFSWGAFFQRPAFGDYGEGNEGYDALGSLITFLLDGTRIPSVLGNRDLRPQKTIAFEVGLEQNLADNFVLDITGYYKDIRNTVRPVMVEAPGALYWTNGNGDYADVRGYEFSLRVLPEPHWWGTLWGYANYTTQIGIDGFSGDPIAIKYDGTERYGPSGDFVQHNNPRLKVGAYYQAPSMKGMLGMLLGGLFISLDHQVVYPNEELLDDSFYIKEKTYLRPPDINTNLRVKKDIIMQQGAVRIQPYLEVHNLFNQKWVYLDAIYTASIEEQIITAESDFEDMPERNAYGTPIFDMAKYRNLPRSVIFGLTIQL